MGGIVTLCMVTVLLSLCTKTDSRFVSKGGGFVIIKLLCKFQQIQIISYFFQWINSKVYLIWLSKFSPFLILNLSIKCHKHIVSEFTDHNVIITLWEYSTSSYHQIHYMYSFIHINTCIVSYCIMHRGTSLVL